MTRPGKKYKDRPFWMGTECEDMCVPSECLSKSDSAEKYLNNQMDKFICSVEVSQPAYFPSYSSHYLSWTK